MLYNVIESSASSNGYNRYIIASFDNKKEALVYKIENNWGSMGKYKNYPVKEDFVFSWEPSTTYVIPISKEILMTYDSEKLEYISKSQGIYFKEGSPVCYIEEK